MTNRRYLISLGFMETDPKIIQEKTAFSYWQKIRERFAHEVEGLILGFCTQNGIYEPFIGLTRNSRNPERFDGFDLKKSLRGNFWSSKIPKQVTQFAKAVSSYEEECKKREGLFGDGRRFSKAMRKVPSERQMVRGVYAPSEKIEGLVKSIDKLTWHLGNSDISCFESEIYRATGKYDTCIDRGIIPLKRSIVAEVIY